MPYRLLRFGLSRKHPEPRMFTRHETLRSAYDAVIIGAGGRGLAAAYYLARDHGMRNIAVLEKGYIGGGNTGRNTTIIRSNYLTPEGVKFYDESVRLWQDLSADFDLNLFYSTRGHFTLAHTDSAMRTMRWRAEVNRHFDVAKALAMGADAVAIGQGVLIALGCNSESYIANGQHHSAVEDYTRLGTTPGFCHHCHTGKCPVGVTTQDAELELRLEPAVGAKRLRNYLKTLNMELTTIARACGKQDVHHLEKEDLVALTVEAAAMAGIPLAGTSWVPGQTAKAAT